MALFKSRKESQDAAASAAPSESVESLRRRARQRLIGASVLVLIGVIGFPLLFDTQPRPVPVDIPIEIPDRNKARSLPITQPTPEPPKAAASAAEPTAGAVAEPVAPAAKSAVSEGLGPKEEVVSASPAAKPEVAKAESAKAESAKAEPAKPEAAKAEAAKADPAKPGAARVDDGSRAKALLEGKTDTKADPKADTKTADAAATGDRFVVQVGAYADAEKARDVRKQLERAGLKTYTHIAETGEGKRIRVRVGPFPTRPEADRVAQKVKSLGLPVAVLVL